MPHKSSQDQGTHEKRSDEFSDTTPNYGMTKGNDAESQAT